jgi:hypothetical protein
MVKDFNMMVQRSLQQLGGGEVCSQSGKGETLNIIQALPKLVGGKSE